VEEVRVGVGWRKGEGGSRVEGGEGLGFVAEVLDKLLRIADWGRGWVGKREFHG
jgi:hypothetical protein